MDNKVIYLSKDTPQQEDLITLTQGDNKTYQVQFIADRYGAGVDFSTLVWSVNMKTASGEIYTQAATVVGYDDSYIRINWTLTQAATPASGSTFYMVEGRTSAQDSPIWRSCIYEIHVLRAIDGGVAYEGADINEVEAIIDDIRSDVQDLSLKALTYPTDSEGDIVLPTSEKMLTVKSDGTTAYDDIPVGDVVKDLLFNSFTDDESKTTVNITINTSGTPATGEVQSLRNTMQVLTGEEISGQDVGQVNITDADYLWYVGNGVGLILPVTPGHVYKFVAETPRQEDAWYAPTAAFFAPDFDFDFATAYEAIPETAGSIEFSPENHSTDGTGRIFDGSGVVVPEGMHYFIVNVINLMKDIDEEDDIRVFEVYDYTEYPIDAEYDKIVENPVTGDTYNITYALTRSTSSNTATTVSGSDQYQTTITADPGKIITSCSVKIGGQVYTTTTDSLTINDADSNIKIIVTSGVLPDDTYVGAYEIKSELIPAALLASKLNVPTGFSDAVLGQILYTDGNGGLTVGDVPSDYISLWAALAPTFDSSASYVVGQYVTYNSKVWRFKAEHEGSWNSADVDEVTIGTELYNMTVNGIDKKVPYPTDSEDDVIFPVAEKMLTIKPDGSADYEDIPDGDVSKSLLMDAFTEEDSKTKVNITINTSGTPVTGEVQSLRDTIQVLKGDESITPAVGQVALTISDAIWYVSYGVSLIMPVIPGHTYKFVPKTPEQEDAWYPPTGAYFAPGFDFDANTAYVAIPNTEGSIEFSPEVHSTDGTGRIFDGSGVIVPEGMYYFLLNVVSIMSDDSQEDGIREFEVYDYTEYPTDATYDLIVEDPVVGDTYKIAYALTRTTSSNTATTVGGSAQYTTVITADAGKIISSCDVKVGNHIYSAQNGTLTINDSASNIKIIAAAESPPDNTYVGAYEIKKELIPADLLAVKLDVPDGLSSAEAGQMLYTDGSGGLIIADAPIVPNNKASMDWVNVYSKWAAGYYYDPDNDYAYTQIPSTERTWGETQTYINTSCTPYSDMIPVEVGERYRYQNMPIHFDSKNAEIPSIFIFDSSKELIISYTRTYQDVYTEFTIPKGGAWMAVMYYNNQTYLLQKYDIKTVDKFDVLNAINATYRAYLLGNPPIKKTLDKAYFCLGSDDLRPYETKSIHTLYTSNSIPYYMAAIPEAVKSCVTNDPYKTNYDYMQLCLAAGGEIICHSDDWITSANVDDYNTLYKYFCENKRELEAYGFDVRGIFKAGGDGAIQNADKRIDAWAAYLFDYSDIFGYTFPYRTGNRQFFEWINTSTIDAVVNNAFNNNSYGIFGLHEVNTAASNMFDYFMSLLASYTRGVDYDFITPYELYTKLMPEPTQD